MKPLLTPEAIDEIKKSVMDREIIFSIGLFENRRSICLEVLGNSNYWDSIAQMVVKMVLYENPKLKLTWPVVFLRIGLFDSDADAGVTIIDFKKKSLLERLFSKKVS